MFYSLEKKLVFIHIPKTAGTSLKIALKPYACPTPETVSRHAPLIHHLQHVSERLRERGKVFPNHMTYREVEAFTDIDLAESTVLSVVRNPWTRMQSLYQHIARDPSHGLHDLALERGFKGFLAAILKQDVSVKAPDTGPQLSYLLDTDGGVGVRTLLKQEQLVSGLHTLCSKLGLHLSLPHTNSMLEDTPAIEMDNETHEMIASYEAGIIQLLGYSDKQPEGHNGAYLELRETRPRTPGTTPETDNIDAQKRVAMQHLRQGRAAEAVNALTEVLKVQPEDPVALHFLGLARHHLGQPVEALRLMQRSVELAPGQPEFWRNLGSQRKYGGALDEAASALEAALELSAQDADAWASLCEVRYRQDQQDSARQAGQRALDLKDAATSSTAALSRAAVSVPPFEPNARPRNVISMSLFGTDGYYHEGALLNAQLARVIYPEWMCRFYCDASIPRSLIDALVDLGAQVIRYPEPARGNEALFWRFRVANDPDVDRFLCRDCDSPFTPRERVAVEEWIDLKTPFHVMRDHVIHVDLILAGLWGGVAGLLPDMNALAASQLNDDRGRWADQKMLGREIWPRIRHVVTVHDSHYTTGNARPFPRYGTLPLPLHVGYSLPRSTEEPPDEFQIP